MTKSKTEKQCTSCKKIQPVEIFAIATQEGYRSGACKLCVSIQKFNGTEEEYLQYKIKEKERILLGKQGKKICSICKDVKSLDKFNKSKSGYLGLRPCCKDCSKDYWAEYYNKESTTLIKKKREYIFNKKTPKEKDKSTKRNLYVKELHLLQKDGKRRCGLCDDIKLLDDFPNDFSGMCFYNKKSYCKKCAYEKWRVPMMQTEKYKKMKSVWDKRYSSKPASKKKLNEHMHNKYMNDPIFKIKVLLRNRINKALIRGMKPNSAVKLLGCTIDELKVHLEDKFYNNSETNEKMTWENHGVYGWHIDHIKPLDAFDLEDREQYAEAVHYTNLQPLWCKENLSKGAKF